MEQLQLTDSLVRRFAGEEHTFFIGHHKGRYGMVAAGSWETVLPFRFRRIAVLPDGSLAVYQGRRRTVYRLVETECGVEARQVERDFAEKAVGLPA